MTGGKRTQGQGEKVGRGRGREKRGRGRVCEKGNCIQPASKDLGVVKEGKVGEAVGGQNRRMDRGGMRERERKRAEDGGGAPMPAVSLQGGEEKKGKKRGSKRVKKRLEKVEDGERKSR